MRRDETVAHAGLHPDFEEEKRYFDEGQVYAVQIELNLACPQGCLYCYASQENPPVREMPRDDVLAVVDAAADMGVRAIDWLGGDPLVRDDWYELMLHAQQQGLVNNIWTSGMPLQDAAVARKAVEVSHGGFISVHLDSLDEEIYAQLHTGNATSKIQAILAGVDNVQAMGKKPEHMVNCITFTRVVAGDAARTIRYFWQEKGMRTCLTQMCPTGLAEDRNDLVPTLQQIEAACTVRDEVNYPGSSLSICSMDTSKYYCGGIICVTVDGDVTPCSVIREGVGNIHEAPLQTIVEQHWHTLLFGGLRDGSMLPEDCRDCKHNAVCWGCRAAAYYASGDNCGMDPNCYRRK